MRRSWLVIIAVAGVACSSPQPAASPTLAASSPIPPTSAPVAAPPLIPSAIPSAPASPPSPQPTNMPTLAPAATAPPTTPLVDASTAEVVYFLTAPNDRLFRVVVAIKNPAGQVREGVQTRWEATDATGAIVGSSTTTHPPIAPGSTYLYVGGAGSANLSGVPAAVRVTLTNPGVLSNAASRFLEVDTVTLTKVESQTYRGLDDYEVSAVLSTGSETFDRANLTTSYVLRNQPGEIVGANFTSVGGNLPDELTAGNRYRLENRVPATGPAVAAEVTAYRRP